jgi:hypothetical protein
LILTDNISIKAPPDDIFRFFEEIDRHYMEWHPDHVLYRWEKGHGVALGNEFYFEELIAGKLLKKRVVFTEVRPNEHVEFAPTFWLMRLFLPRMLFRIDRRPAECILTAEIHLRLGPLAAWLNRKELAAVRDHMRAEGINLKRIVEGGLR